MDQEDLPIKCGDGIEDDWIYKVATLDKIRTICKKVQLTSLQLDTVIQWKMYCTTVVLSDGYGNTDAAAHVSRS